MYNYLFLFVAAAKGEVGFFARPLDRGADASQAKGGGLTALYKASQKGHLAVAAAAGPKGGRQPRFGLIICDRKWRSSLPLCAVGSRASLHSARSFGGVGDDGASRRGGLLHDAAPGPNCD